MLTLEELMELNIIINLAAINYNNPEFDSVAISNKGNNLLNKFLTPYKVSQVDDNATKVE